MTLVDRFVCRREGHVPAVKLTATSWFKPDSYITSCVRCGKAFEVKP